MRRGDVKLLARIIGVNRATIWRRAKKAGVNLNSTCPDRDPQTPDMFTGQTLEEEHMSFLVKATKELS